MKADHFPELTPQLESKELRGLTLWQLNKKLLRLDMVIDYLDQHHKATLDAQTYLDLLEMILLRRKVKRAIAWISLKNYLFSLVGR